MMAGLVDRLRSRLHAAAAARLEAARWRAEYKALRGEYRERGERERESRERLKAQSEQRARRIPSTETLQHMLRSRTALAQRRAARLNGRASAAPDVDLAGCARRIMLDGLTWWVPVLPSQSPASVERMMAKQRLPYLAIGQTREVSVGGIMLDVGANVGRMAIPRAILGDATRVFCAEADELNYRCLAANIHDNGLAGLIVAEHVAISDREGYLPLERRKMSGSHRIVYDEAVAQVEEVPCTTLDRFVERHGIDLAEVTFVKVDTQGSEAHVLAGASRVLEQPHIAWQIEIAPSHLRRAGSEPAALYRLLMQRFSHFFDMNPDAEGPRLRPMADLPSALAYVEREQEAQTDVVVYRAV
jgi:FkbM family methyltransferase